MRALVILSLLLAASAAWAGDVLELHWYDRTVHDARLRGFGRIEMPSLSVGPVVPFVRIEALARGAEDDPGHLTPLWVDLGAGVGWSMGPWTWAILLSSEHCFDRECPGVNAYNAFTVRYAP